MHASSAGDANFQPVILEAAPGTSGKKTLLVVDDESGPREALQVLFRDNYHVLLAEDGIKAMELVHLRSVDAVILDLRMPVMDGIEVLNHLKKIDPAIEVIILTAYETLETARQALRLGACDYLTKPFDIHTMRQAVAAATERRALSNAIQSDHQKLEQLQAEIQQQRLQQEIARARGDIYASIIHDINGPLTIISGFVGMINSSIGQAPRVEGETLNRVKEQLERIHRQVNNCVQICRRYLSFLKGGSGEIVAVGVNQVLNDLGELLKVHPDAQRNSLSIEPLPRDVCAQIHGTDLIQILLNLTINGLQSSPQFHDVKVTGELLPDALPLNSHTDGPKDRFVRADNFGNSPPLLALSVKDNGPGIAPDHVGKLFHFQFTTKPGGQGTGLGLSIVKRLVEQAKGAIQLHTEPGRGSLFTVYLPACDASGDR